MRIFYLSCLLLFVLSCTLSERPESETVIIPMQDRQPDIDGVFDNDEWNKATVIKNFKRPWTKGKELRTEFFALTDANYFYFAYKCKDEQIVLSSGSEEIDVAKSDRVEIFFAKKPDLKEYYCLEIDPNGRILDYMASHYRVFNYSWRFPGITTKGKLNKEGYTVEGKISLDVLTQMGLIDLKNPDLCFFAGLYRADFKDDKENDLSVEWISWTDPKTREPDFHVPSSFGRFCLEYNKP